MTAHSARSLPFSYKVGRCSPGKGVIFSRDQFKTCRILRWLMERNFREQPQYVSQHRQFSFSINEPWFLFFFSFFFLFSEAGRIRVRKMSKLSSSTSVYSCGLHLSKLVSKLWRQLKSSINNTGHTQLATNTLYLIDFGPILC